MFEHLIMAECDVDTALALASTSRALYARSRLNSDANPWHAIARRLGVEWLPEHVSLVVRCCVELERNVDFLFAVFRDDSNFRALLDNRAYSGDALLRSLSSLRGGFVRRLFRARFNNRTSRSDMREMLEAERTRALLLVDVRSFDELRARHPRLDADVAGRAARARRRASALVARHVDVLSSVSVVAVHSLTPLDDSALLELAIRLRRAGLAYADGRVALSTRDGVASLGADGVVRVDDAPSERAAHRAYAALQRLVADEALPEALSFSIASAREHCHLTRLQARRWCRKRVLECGARAVVKRRMREQLGEARLEIMSCANDVSS